nr:MAG TPA: hypothetical protein [Caudoviricetes sp.]
MTDDEFAKLRANMSRDTNITESGMAVRRRT